MSNPIKNMDNYHLNLLLVVLTENKYVLTRKQKVRMSLQDVFLYAMTLTAEFALLLLGIKCLLLHWWY